MRRPATRPSDLVALALTFLALGVVAVTSSSVASANSGPAQQPPAPPETTETPPQTTAAPAPTTAPAGPQPRGSRRVSTDIDTEKIRPASLPLRAMGIATASTIAGLAICGFVYGKVRSRVPAVTGPRVPTPAEPTPAEHPGPRLPPGAPLPPPSDGSGPIGDDTNPWAPPRPD